MTIKKRTLTKENAIETLANELCDKPYGDTKYEDISRVTISLPSAVLRKLEDLAINNKRNKRDLKSVSALVRYSIENTFHV